MSMKTALSGRKFERGSLSRGTRARGLARGKYPLSGTNLGARLALGSPTGVSRNTICGRRVISVITYDSRVFSFFLYPPSPTCASDGGVT